MCGETRPVTHKDLIARLSTTDRALLLEKSDWAGGLQLAQHLAALLVTGSWIALGLPGWPLVLVLHGILIVFLFAALHECLHETAFASGWVNRAVAVAAGFLLVLPPLWFRAFHFAHHRHTNDPTLDPEIAGQSRLSRSAYFWRMTGIPVWHDHLSGLFRIAWGRSLETFVPDKARRRTIAQARLFVVGYGALTLASFAVGSTALLWLWIIPALLGQPFLRAYLMAEHTGCPQVSNMLENSRTTLTNRIVRTLAWNMPFHAEHHSYPSVPFHKLPAFHKHIRDDLGTTSEGYVAFHRGVLRPRCPVTER